MIKENEELKIEYKEFLEDHIERKNLLYLYDIINYAVVKKINPEFIDSYIEENIIPFAIPININEIRTLQPKDGDNFIISVENDIIVEPELLNYKGKKVTITIQGSGKQGKEAEKVCLANRFDTMFQIFKGAVLILKDIELRANNWRSEGLIQVNGGILVKKNSIVANGFAYGSVKIVADQYLFCKGDNINDAFVDCISSNGSGIIMY